MTPILMPRGAHLVGSVPLADSAAVFSAAVAALGDRLRRLSDGETGERTNWINWQFPVLARTPGLEVVPPDPAAYKRAPRVRRAARSPGVNGVVLPPLGYARAALESWTVFQARQQRGLIPPRMRFQVSLPTPLAPVTVFVTPEDRGIVEPAYETRMLAELDEILAGIPHDALAIQWDVAVEMALLEGLWPHHLVDVRREITARLARLASRVPLAVELGFHLCYGDLEHRHFVQPANAMLLARLANDITAAAHRPIDWVHLPVPADRDDEAYFAPLADLALQPATELYLGVLHARDGTAGAWRRIAAAQRVVPRFGVATECGLGRRPSASVARLLLLHAATSIPW